MEVEIVRHHRGPQNADRDVEHAGIAHDLRRWNKSFRDAEEVWMRSENLPGETTADNNNERDHQRLDVTKPLVLQEQNEQDVQRSDAHARQQRETEEQIQRYGGANDFGKVAGRDRDFANYPEKYRNRFAVVIAAGLGKIAAGSDPEFEGE